MAVGVKDIAVIGSTGSIGRQAVEVVKDNMDRFRIVALAAHRDWETLAVQAKEFRPEVVAVADPDVAKRLAAVLPRGIDLLVGPAGLCSAAAVGDVALNCVVGFAGLEVTIAALEADKRLALANKESLVAGGEVVRRAMSSTVGEIVPVDSEHCAIHQCLRATADSGEVSKLIITSSGGPFRGFTPEQLGGVTVDQALHHPNWVMGPKITVDSSTLMNKGLEVIEAHMLFGIAYERIEVVIHPQSVVHSMVEFTDGATLAQLSNPDMMLPIGYALGYPRRLGVAYGGIDWAVLKKLEFDQPDRRAFRCLAIAEEAGRLGGPYPAWLNAANEIAVEAFLAGRIGWQDIARIVEDTVSVCDGAGLGSVEDVVDADRKGRLIARKLLEGVASL
ncbi:MAG: 1-deoxy-D-xylulose-5-phosphate reductoisomerase [Acidimicrobiales bacterium]